MPTTPRTASGHYSSTNAATPRSSRRLTTSFNTPSRLPLTQPPELPALPPLNTKKYPERPYAEDHEFTQLLQQDMLQVDEAVEMLSHSTEEVRRQLRENLTHLESEKLGYQNKIKELGEVAKEMVRTQGKEREELEGAKGKEEEVARQQAKLKVRLEGYQQEVKEALAKLNQRKNLKAKQKAAFESRLSQNKPELDFFEQKLGLKIRGRGNDIVQFKFHNLDRTSYSRTFSFDLNVSTSSYTLSALSPQNFIPDKILQESLDESNESRDLYGFVREMRWWFCCEVEVEKRVGVGKGEEEREREREKIGGRQREDEEEVGSK